MNLICPKMFKNIQNINILAKCVFFGTRKKERLSPLVAKLFEMREKEMEDEREIVR